MAETTPPRTMLGPWRAYGRIDPAMALVAGLGAGVMATAAQLALWWLTEMPLAETFFRDARLTAALVMGTAVLPPPSTAQWDILLVATLIHFALSIAYAVIPAYLASRLRSGPTLVAGALYGLVIYVVNLYGFTELFPWFVVARDWVTLVAHLVFGVSLAAGCRLFFQGSMEPKVAAERNLAMHEDTADADAIPRLYSQLLRQHRRKLPDGGHHAP